MVVRRQRKLGLTGSNHLICATLHRCAQWTRITRTTRASQSSQTTCRRPRAHAALLKPAARTRIFQSRAHCLESAQWASQNCTASKTKTWWIPLTFCGTNKLQWPCQLQPTAAQRCRRSKAAELCKTPTARARGVCFCANAAALRPSPARLRPLQWTTIAAAHQAVAA